MLLERTSMISLVLVKEEESPLEQWQVAFAIQHPVIRDDHSITVTEVWGRALDQLVPAQES